MSPRDPAVRAPRASTGLGSIMVATLVAGVIGYLVQGIIPTVVTDPAAYLPFSVFWSALYLVVAALSGLQQEVTRATRPLAERAAVRPPSTPREPASLVRFATMAAIVVAGVGALSAPWWGPSVFVQHTWLLVAALLVGVTGYTLVAVASGLFYGVQFWRAVAAMTITDAVLRLIAIAIVLASAPTLPLLAAAVVLPFPVSLLLVWGWARTRVDDHHVDVPTSELARNAVRTVGGATATGVLTSGFPLLIDLTSVEPDASVGALVFVITLTRAPLVVPALALQSFLTVRFRERSEGILRHTLGLVGAVLAVSALIGLVAWPLEPVILRALWGDAYVVDGLTCALIVATAGMTAALCVSGAATVATNRHSTFLAGWVVAAIATVLLMLLPLPLTPRVLVAMGVGPALGLLVHLAGLAARPGGNR